MMTWVSIVYMLFKNLLLTVTKKLLDLTPKNLILIGMFSLEYKTTLQRHSIYQMERQLTTMKKLDILYLTDNNYATFAGVSITSLFMNNKNIDKITVYLIDDNISDENKKLFCQLAHDFNREIIFLDLTKGIQI